MKIRIYDDGGEYIDTFDGIFDEAQNRTPHGGFAYLDNKYWSQKTRATCFFCKGKGNFPEAWICEHCSGNGGRWQLEPLCDDSKVQGLLDKALKAETGNPEG